VKLITVIVVFDINDFPQ